MSQKKSSDKKPFGLSFLTEVPASELAKLNGGRRRHGPVVTTMHVSMPQPAFPSGDHG